MTGSLLAAGLTLAVTPAPTLPPDNVPDVDVTPGVWGFIAIACVAVATIFLIVDMVRRTRRTQYRAQVREQLEAEARGEFPEPASGTEDGLQYGDHDGVDRFDDGADRATDSRPRSVD